MSDHDIHTPTREEIVACITRPIPKRLGTLSLILAVVGFAIFIIGVVTGNARAWQAYHVNWLFFTTFSSAPRTSTARWPARPRGTCRPAGA